MSTDAAREPDVDVYGPWERTVDRQKKDRTCTRCVSYMPIGEKVTRLVWVIDGELQIDFRHYLCPQR